MISKIMCYFGFHSGYCENGYFRCVSCDYKDKYTKIKEESK